MSERTAKTIVLLAGGLSILLSARSAGGGELRLRRVGAAMVITLGLSALADISPEVAGPFALLVLIAVYAHYSKGGRLSILPTGTDVNPATNPRAAGPPAPTR